MALRITRVTDARGGVSFLRSWKPWTIAEFVARRKKSLTDLGIPFEAVDNVFTYSDGTNEYRVEFRDDDQESSYARR